MSHRAALSCGLAGQRHFWLHISQRLSKLNGLYRKTCCSRWFSSDNGKSVWVSPGDCAIWEGRFCKTSRTSLVDNWSQFHSFSFHKYILDSGGFKSFMEAANEQMVHIHSVMIFNQDRVSTMYWSCHINRKHSHCCWFWDLAAQFVVWSMCGVFITIYYSWSASPAVITRLWLACGSMVSLSWCCWLWTFSTIQPLTMSCAGSTWKNGAWAAVGWRRLGVSGTGPCQRRVKPKLRLSLWSPAPTNPDTASEGRARAQHFCPTTRPQPGESLSANTFFVHASSL